MLSLVALYLLAQAVVNHFAFGKCESARTARFFNTSTAVLALLGLALLHWD
jgi:uncharacterized membrane protein